MNPPLLAGDELLSFVAEAAQVVDPQGENVEVSLVCGLVGYALSHPASFDGWDRETVLVAVAWNWRGSPEFAAEMAELVS